MIHFIIAGKPNCRSFVQSISIAMHLKESLPCFEFTKLEYADDIWDDFLSKINREHHWNHTSSPLIYKELYYYGTKKPVLIGGIGEFYEYCYSYYGLESKLSAEELDDIQKENERAFEEKAVVTDETREYKVMIYGATNSMTSLLLPEFMKIDGCGNAAGLQFLLYDEKLLDDDNMNFFMNFNNDFKDMFGTQAHYCDNLGKGLRECDLLILIDDISAFESSSNEEKQQYLLQMFFLAEEINLVGNRSMKIIFANSGKSCLFATILARRVQLPMSQIVAVSSDLGLGYLGEMSRRLEIKTNQMGAPPVWGSLGFNEFVDAGSTLIKCKIYKPYPRAVHASPNSTLTHGTIYCELRFINYLSDEIADLKETVNRRREIIKEKLQRAPQLAKLEATLNLIKIWCGRTAALKSPIMSLGIMSDGSFGIPEKIVFSQPAIRFKDGWVPYSKYPVPEHILKDVMKAGVEADQHYEEYATGNLFKKAKSSFPEYKMQNSQKNMLSTHGALALESNLTPNESNVNTDSISAEHTEEVTSNASLISN